GEAGSSTWAARLLFDQFVFGLPGLHRSPTAFPPLEQRRANLRQLLQSLGLPQAPRLVDTVLADRTFALPAALASAAPEGAPDGAGEAPAAALLRWLRESAYEELRAESGRPDGEPDTLLSLLLRHSVL